MLRSILMSALLGLTSLSCHAKDNDNNSTAASSSTGLVITGATSQNYPWQSNLYRIDPDFFTVETLLQGESSDPALFNTGGSVFLFNRTDDSQNYRLITPQNNTLVLADQQKFADGSVGDPHDVLDLGNGNVLLAHYVQGKLTVMNKATGAKVSEVTADWDLPDGVALKPEALWKTTVGDHTYIYVLHQAYAFEGNLFIANGTQKAFVLEQTGDTITPVDLDPVAAKVQGIKLASSFPIAVRPHVQGSKLLIAGLCSRFVSPSQNDPSLVCHSAIEELDPATQTVTTLWNLDGSAFYMNGSAIAADASHSIFVQVERKIDDSTFKKQVVKLNADTKADATVYDYPDASGGYYGLFYDETRANLIIGDVGTTAVGKFTVIKADGTKIDKDLDAIPYSGVFIF